MSRIRRNDSLRKRRNVFKAFLDGRPFFWLELVVDKEGADVVWGEFFAAFKKSQFDEEGDTYDVAAQGFDHLGAGFHGAASGEKVIDEEDTLTGVDAVLVDFEFVGAVFEFVFLGQDVAGEFAGFANEDKAGFESLGGHGGEDEAAAFGAGDNIDVLIFEGIDDCLGSGLQTLGVREQSGDVEENYTGFGEVRYATDKFVDRMKGRIGLGHDFFRLQGD
jgi:hypothetical protein